MQSLEEVAICDVYPYERADGEPMNPRDFTTRESAEHIAGLAAQFKANRLNPGQPVMKPILYKEGGIYWIIDGECRVRAMRAIGTERFLAEVYDDLDDAELARVEAAKAMVETDAKLGLTAEEKSRGVQTMLALDIPDEEVAVAMGWRAAWNMSGWTAWSLMEGGSSVYFNRATVENVTIIYEAMKADGYEPNAAETETYEACMARLGSEE